MSDSALAEFDAGEADYFNAILAMQSASQQSLILPEPLLAMIQTVKSTIQKEGVSQTWAKPVFMDAPELAAFGTAEYVCVLHRQTAGMQEVIAIDHNGAVGLANLLLGGKPTKKERMPSPIENQIVQGFAALLGADFKTVEAPDTSIVWQNFIGAKLAFYDEANSPFLVFMINRRSENPPAQQPNRPDIQQQNFMRQAVGNSMVNVDYVLDGGTVSLAMLRNLAPGSVLPLASLNGFALEARANGKTVFSGNLKLTEDQMAMNVAHVLTGSRNE
jgi:flagellar motor switch/type III secretory pathway protein FliN